MEAAIAIVKERTVDAEQYLFTGLSSFASLLEMRAAESQNGKMALPT